VDGEEAVMDKPISERQVRKALNFMAEGVLMKTTKRHLAKRFRESAGEKRFYPGDTLTITYTVNVTHTFPDKKSKKA
jgi:hypothetical protein